MITSMEHVWMKSTLIALWILGVAVVGALAGTSGSGWLTLTAVAVLPAAVMLWFWMPPAVTTSESINRARR
jgi:hypothetical protein